MSLICRECEQVMGPSTTLPGREGTLIHPIVPAMIWLPDKAPQIGQTLAYVEAPDNLSLCFACFEKQLPQDQYPLLEKIYNAYKKEIDFNLTAQSQKELLPWQEGDQIDQSFAAWQAFKASMELPFLRACLSCGIQLPQNLEPYFIAKTIDKVYSQKNPTNFFGEINYSISDLRTGMTSFKLCFDCVRTKFPHIHEDLSYRLRGINHRSAKQTKNEIYLSTSFLQALDNSNSEEAQALLEKLVNNPQTDVFIQPPDNGSGKPNLN